MFKTLNDFKAAAEFFPCGRIVPQRVLKGPKKYKHKVTFGADCWMIPSRKGHVFFVDTAGTENGCFIRINIKQKAELIWHPYTKDVNTYWTMNVHEDGRTETDEKLIEKINSLLKY